MTWTVCGYPVSRGPCRLVCPTCTIVSPEKMALVIGGPNGRPTIPIGTGSFSCRLRRPSLHGVRANYFDPQVRRFTALRIERRAGWEREKGRCGVWEGECFCQFVFLWTSGSRTGSSSRGLTSLTNVSARRLVEHMKPSVDLAASPVLTQSQGFDKTREGSFLSLTFFPSSGTRRGLRLGGCFQKTIRRSLCWGGCVHVFRGPGSL